MFAKTDRCIRDADQEEALVQLHTPGRSAQDPLIVPHARPNRCERNPRLLPQLPPCRLLKGFTWLDAATRRTPIDGHIRETLVERCGNRECGTRAAAADHQGRAGAQFDGFAEHPGGLYTSHGAS